MRAFAATLDAIEVTRCARTDTDAALIVPGYLDTSYPFTDPADRAHIARTLAQAYVSARLADLPVALTRETSGIGERRAAVPGPLGEAAARADRRRPWSGSRPAAPASTCPTRRATPDGTAGRRTGG